MEIGGLDLLAAHAVAGNAVEFPRPDAGLSQTFLRNESSYFLIQNQTSTIGAIALVVSLSAYPYELASLADAQVLDAFLREDLPGRFFYDRQTVVSLRDTYDSFEKLRFLIRQRELLFKLFDALLWRQWAVLLGHGPHPRRAYVCAWVPVLPTVLTQPCQNGRLALNPVTRLSLFIAQLAFFDLIDDR